MPRIDSLESLSATAIDRRRFFALVGRGSLAIAGGRILAACGGPDTPPEITTTRGTETTLPSPARREAVAYFNGPERKKTLDDTMHGMAVRIIAASGRDRRFGFVKNDLLFGGRQTNGPGWGILTNSSETSLPNGDRAQIDLVAYRKSDGSFDLDKGIVAISATTFGPDGKTKKISANLTRGFPPTQLGGEPRWVQEGYAVFIERAGVPTPDDEVKAPDSATLEQFRNTDTRGIAFVNETLLQCGV